ncbi:MAG: hypothetical protein WA919_09765 [Coleofasciculaceae cyanobacterium]
MVKISTEDIRERLGNVEKIRDILFGAKLREYDSSLEKLESTLSRLQQEMAESLEQTKISLSQEIRTSIESLEQKIKSVSSNLQEEEIELKTQLEYSNNKLSRSLESLDGVVQSQTSALKEEASETSKQIQQDISKLKQAIFQELEKRFTDLQDIKVSRYDLSETLLELSLRLKGSDWLPELKKVGDQDTDQEAV